MVARVVDLRKDDFAEGAFLDIALCRLIGFIGHALHADLHLDPRLLDLLDNLLALVDRAGQWLFAVDVLACVRRVQRDRRMPMIRHGDDNVVDVRLREYFAVVPIRPPTG